MATSIVNKNMRLFGLPYQFREQVDPRISAVSPNIGHNYTKNILLDAPIATIIPGKPKYLPGSNEKNLTTRAVVSAMSGEMSSLQNIIANRDGKQFRYYDFSSSYMEYMRYVNVLCRTCADFLGLNDPKYSINGYNLTKYDWKNYRMSGQEYSSVIGGVSSNLWSSIKQSLSSGDDEDYSEASSQENSSFQTYNFTQFYVDPSVSCSESMSNDTSESKIKGVIDGASDWMKEISFIANSAGAGAQMDGLAQFAGDSMESLGNGLRDMGVTGTIGDVLGNVLSLSSNVIKGENIIIPDIYQSSSYSKSYEMTVHLRSPYANRYGYYMDVVAPLMHLLALSLPRQATANSYISPFLVKVYVPGLFNCNLGMVKSISINKNSDSFSVDGYPCDIDVTLDIADLYSDLSLTPSNSPFLFANNTSLVEYLANTCGLSLMTPNLSTRLNLIAGSAINAIKDIPGTVVGGITERIDSVVASFLSLT